MRKKNFLIEFYWVSVAISYLIIDPNTSIIENNSIFPNLNALIETYSEISQNVPSLDIKFALNNFSYQINRSLICQNHIKISSNHTEKIKIEINDAFFEISSPRASLNLRSLEIKVKNEIRYDNLFLLSDNSKLILQVDIF